MIHSAIEGFRIAGLACAVPTAVQTVEDLGQLTGSDEAGRIAATTGVRHRRIAPLGTCTSDLLNVAAERLLENLAWDRETVQGLIVVTQTPDYRIPATACVLHERLRLSKSCIAYDVNLGCSGYVYGLWLAAQAARSGLTRVLLMAGDTISRLVSNQDRSTLPLFGDAGSVTAIERVPGASGLHFVLGTDGSGWRNLNIPAGGCRLPNSSETMLVRQRESGNMRSDEQLLMNGPEVFAFTLREVPLMLKKLLGVMDWRLGQTDAFIFHQANKFMLDYLSRKTDIPVDRMPLSLDAFGNTSSASVPLTIAHALRERLTGISASLVLAGFGVGWSWAAAGGCIGPLCIPPIVEYEGRLNG